MVATPSRSREKKVRKRSLPVGIFSRFDYLRDGSRVGLLDLAYQIFAERKTKFVVWAGGVICKKTFKEILNANVQERRVKGHKISIRTKNMMRADLIDQVAHELADILPRIEGVKTYIICSDAFDGDEGAEVVRTLAKLRDDVRATDRNHHVFELQQFPGKHMGVYVPPKMPMMRSEYYDTAVHRILSDELKRGSHDMGDFVVAGCFSSAIVHPGDSTRIGRPYVSVPGLSQIDVNRTAENQIGVCIVNFDSENVQEADVEFISFKDLVSNEWAMIGSQGIQGNDDQKRIVEAMSQSGPLTVGQLVTKTDLSRSRIKAALKLLMRVRRSTYWPGIIKDEESDTYHFDPDHFQHKLRYTLPLENATNESYLAFSCLHAGCRHSDMQYFCEEVPKIMLRRNIKQLVGCGDFIEGTAHTLLNSGEMFGSFHFTANNYDYMECLAAYQVLQVISKVFDVRFKKSLRKLGKKRTTITRSGVVRLIRDALIKFTYIPGNHCEWTHRREFTALTNFTRFLNTYVEKHLRGAVEKAKLPSLSLADIQEILEAHLVRRKDGEGHEVDDNFETGITHPSMGRTMTTSIRLQSALGHLGKKNIVFLGNYHVAQGLGHWQPNMGQRICCMASTLKHKSKFEHSKGKTVDFGVTELTTRRFGERIVTARFKFHGKRLDNTDVIQESIRRIQLDFERFVAKHELDLWRTT